MFGIGGFGGHSSLFGMVPGMGGSYQSPSAYQLAPGGGIDFKSTMKQYNQQMDDSYHHPMANPTSFGGGWGSGD